MRSAGRSVGERVIPAIPCSKSWLKTMRPSAVGPCPEAATGASAAAGGARSPATPPSAARPASAAAATPPSAPPAPPAPAEPTLPPVPAPPAPPASSPPPLPRPAPPPSPRGRLEVDEQLASSEASATDTIGALSMQLSWQWTEPCSTRHPPREYPLTASRDGESSSAQISAALGGQASLHLERCLDGVQDAADHVVGLGLGHVESGGHVGLHETDVHGDHLGLLRPQLDAESIGERPGRGLRGAVGRGARQADPAQRRQDVEDRA